MWPINAARMIVYCCCRGRCNYRHARRALNCPGLHQSKPLAGSISFRDITFIRFMLEGAGETKHPFGASICSRSRTISN